IRDFHVTGVQTCALPIYSGAAGSGGGLLLLNAGELILDGRIVAHGGTGSRYAGGGSGGGINIVVGNLSGSGQITANGGDGGFERSEERRVGKERRARGAT